MSNGLIQTGYRLNRQNIIQIFRAPVFFRSRDHIGTGSLSLSVASQFYLFLGQLSSGLRQEFFYDGLMDHQRLTGIADTDTLGLGIIQDLHCHVLVSRGIHINVAVTGTGLDNRYGTLSHHSADQSGTATRDQHIHILIHLHKLGCHLAIGASDQLYSCLRQTTGHQCFLQHSYDGFIGMKSITATF